MKGFFTSRRFRQGSMATAITAVVVALVVVLNAVATTLTDRYSLTLDLTPTKLFSITDETKEYLKGLEKDVTIYVMDTEENFSGANDYFKQANEVLKKFSLESSHISLEYINLVADPTFAQRFPSHQLSAGQSILIVCGDKVRDVTPYDLYETQMTQSYQTVATASRAEQVLTSAILGVTSDTSFNVALLSGHNEQDISPFQELLIKNNYTVESVNPSTTPLDAFHIAVIAAPERDYTEDELRTLDAFLKNDGRYDRTLLYLASSRQTDLPNLSAFLEDWGVAVEPGMVYETDSSRHVVNNPIMGFVDYAESEYSAGVSTAQLMPIAAYSRPLTRLFESKSGISTTVLLQYAGTAGIFTEEEQAQPTGDTIPFMILSRSLSYEGTTALQSQVVTVGSSEFLDQSLLGNANVANSQYMLDLLGSLAGKEDSVKIQSKELSAGTLSITAAQAVGLGVGLAIVLPLVVLITGIVIWARRRHR